jgi:hypothetical protein
VPGDGLGAGHDVTHGPLDGLWRWATLGGLVATWLVIGMGDRSERLKGWLGPERVVMLVCTVTAGILLLYEVLIVGARGWMRGYSSRRSIWSE